MSVFDHSFYKYGASSTCQHCFVSKTTILTLVEFTNNSLYVLTPDLPPPSSSTHAGALQESLNQNFMLIITHREVQREYNLNFSGSSTIQEVKRNVHDLTSIPIRHQLWEGWPTSATDDSMCLAESGLSYPCHRLTVGRRSSPLQTREQSEEVSLFAKLSGE